MSIRARIMVHMGDSNSRKKQEAKLKIWNDGTGTRETGHYKYQLRVGGMNRFGTIKNFPRDTEMGAVALVKMVLDTVIKEPEPNGTLVLEQP